MDTRMIKRFTDFDIKTSRQSILSALTLCRKVKMRFDPKKYVDSVVESGELFDLKSMAYTIRDAYPVPGDIGNNIRIKVYDACIEYYSSIKRDKEMSLYISDDADLAEFMDKSFDKKVWKNIPDENFKLELRARHYMENSMGYARISMEHDMLYNGISIQVDICTDNNRPGESSLRKYKFAQYAQLIIDLDSPDMRIFAVNTNDDYNTQEWKMREGNTVKGVWLDHSAITIYGENAPDDLRVMSATRGFLLMQAAMRKYTDVMENVTVVKRESTAVKRASKIKADNLHIMTKEQNVVRFTPLSDYGIRIVRERKEWQGGHHESPIPHDVSGHWRYYKNGKRVWVKSYHKESPNYKGTGQSAQNVVVVDK